MFDVIGAAPINDEIPTVYFHRVDSCLSSIHMFLFSMLLFCLAGSGCNFMLTCMLKCMLHVWWIVWKNQIVCKIVLVIHVFFSPLRWNVIPIQNLSTCILLSAHRGLVVESYAPVCYVRLCVFGAVVQLGQGQMASCLSCSVTRGIVVAIEPVITFKSLNEMTESPSNFSLATMKTTR